jgi:hypothetical protein
VKTWRTAQESGQLECADLSADLGLAGADRFNIFLIKHDVIGLSVGEICSSGSSARH